MAGGEWYEELRRHNPWLPTADKVIEAEVTYGPGLSTMDLRVLVSIPATRNPTWEDSLPPVPDTEPDILAAALVGLAVAMNMLALTMQGGAYRHELLAAGARVRAMATPGYSWWLPPVENIKPERRAAMLRQVVGDLVASATYQDQGKKDRADEWIRTADAVLHGLWLCEVA